MAGKALISKFNGDIVITDPSNFITHKDWRKSSYGEKSDLIGIKNYICRKSACNDWNCRIFNEETEKEIGKFNVNSGMFGIFNLKEVLDYNPCFNLINSIVVSGISVIIKDFTGEISVLEVLDGNGDSYIIISGEGVDAKTKERINFIGY